MRISDWSSDVCSSDLRGLVGFLQFQQRLQLAVLFLQRTRRDKLAARLREFLAQPPVLRARADIGADTVVDARERPRHRTRHARDRCGDFLARHAQRSEEHTSELQSLMRISYAVFFLKKKTT